jgi:hypothetical protein
VALIGHGHCGKTSVAAGILFSTGATSRLTRVDEGNSITDFDDDEIGRKMTIATAVAALEYSKKKINLIDTPGFNIFINDTKSADPQKIALALEGMKYPAFTGEVTMRADNHQILQPMYVSTFAKVGTSGVKYDVEGTGFGWKTEVLSQAVDSVPPVRCTMDRPPR